jgi:hypothetical protein
MNKMRGLEGTRSKTKKKIDWNTKIKNKKQNTEPCNEG